MKPCNDCEHKTGNIPFACENCKKRENFKKQIEYIRSNPNYKTDVRIYQVMQGIMKGVVFSGEKIVINGELKIWNTETVGQAYPAIHCEEI